MKIRKDLRRQFQEEMSRLRGMGVEAVSLVEAVIPVVEEILDKLPTPSAQDWDRDFGVDITLSVMECRHLLIAYGQVVQEKADGRSSDPGASSIAKDTNPATTSSRRRRREP